MVGESLSYGNVTYASVGNGVSRCWHPRVPFAGCVAELNPDQLDAQTGITWV